MGERGKPIKFIYNVLIQYLSDLWSPLGIHVPILPPIFSLEPQLCHLHLESKRGASVWEHKNIFFNQEGSSTHFKEKCSSQTKILNEEHQHTSMTSHSIFFTISHFTSKHSPLNFEHHFTELSTGSTNSSWLSFHFAFKTLKFDLILNLNIIFSDLVCTIQLFHSCIQIEKNWSNFVKVRC